MQDEDDGDSGGSTPVWVYGVVAFIVVAVIVAFCACFIYGARKKKAKQIAKKGQIPITIAESHDPERSVSGSSKAKLNDTSHSFVHDVSSSKIHKEKKQESGDEEIDDEESVEVVRDDTVIPRPNSPKRRSNYGDIVGKESPKSDKKSSPIQRIVKKSNLSIASIATKS